jgi:hypothetical protein
MIAAVLLLIVPNLPWMKARKWKRMEGDIE